MQFPSGMHVSIPLLTMSSGIAFASCNTSLGACDKLPSPPGLEYLLTVQATESAPVLIGPTGHGNRIFIPITGGKFSGPKLQGIVF